MVGLPTNFLSMYFCRCLYDSKIDLKYEVERKADRVYVLENINLKRTWPKSQTSFNPFNSLCVFINIFTVLLF